MVNKGIKTISIGNIVMGGAGKTPHTLMVAKEYIKREEKVAILSLGYKGKIGYDLHVISDGTGNYFYHPPVAADEAYMLAKNCPEAVVITGKKRELALKKARDEFGATVAILDDGYQYKKLKRDANILLLDHKNPISTGLPFPFGYLREFPYNINRSNIIVFTRAKDDTIPDKVKEYIEKQRIYFSRTIFKKIILKNEEFNIEYFKNAKVAAYSAVASNNTFYKTIESNNMDICFFTSFYDHAVISENTLEGIIAQGKQNQASLFLTTEKDFVKLPAKYQNIFGYIKMEIELDFKENFFNDIDLLVNQ